MNSKEQNSRLLDPNRHRIAQKNALMPGGPQNNNPDPVMQAQGTLNPMDRAQLQSVLKDIYNNPGIA